MVEPLLTFGPRDALSYINYVKPEAARSNPAAIKHPREDLVAYDIKLAEKQWATFAESYSTTSGQHAYVPRESVNGLPCFLCGLPIEKSATFRPGSNEHLKPFYPQCEHLIPAAAVFILFGLPGKVANLTPAQQSIVSKNFLWAHRYCNGVKDAYLFINVFMKSSDIRLILVRMIYHTN